MTEMSPAETVFFAALAKVDPAERAEYLNEACGTDADLRRQVERLLAAHPQVGIKPGAGERPPALGGGEGDAERGSSFRVAHAGEEAQFDQLGLGGLLGSESGQGIVEGQKLVGGHADLLNIDEGDPATTAAVPRGRLAAGVVDQDEAHGLGGRGEEVAATRELAIANQPQVRLMH